MTIFNKLRRTLSSWVTNLARVIDYVPILWNTREWDYTYAVQVFAHQLRRQRDYMATRGQTEDAPMHAQKIDTALALAQKVYDEEYYNWLDQVTDKWGEDLLKLESVPNADGSTTLEFAFRHHPQKEQIQQDIHQAQARGMAAQKRAHKLLWDYIEHNIQTWWD